MCMIFAFDECFSSIIIIIIIINGFYHVPSFSFYFKNYWALKYEKNQNEMLKKIIEAWHLTVTDLILFFVLLQRE